MNSGIKGELTPEGELTRQAILNAARQVFAKQGFLKTEIQDITQRAGKSRATFYNYVGGKTELLLALIAEFRNDRQKLPIVDGEQMFHEHRPLLRYMQTIGHCRQFDPDFAGFMLATMINANLQQMFCLWNAADLSEEDDASAFANPVRMIEAVLSSGAQIDDAAQ